MPVVSIGNGKTLLIYLKRVIMTRKVKRFKPVAKIFPFLLTTCMFHIVQLM